MSDGDEKISMFFLVVCGFSGFFYFAGKSPYMLMTAIVSGYLFFHYSEKASMFGGVQESLKMIFTLAAILVLSWWLCRVSVSQDPEILQCCAGPPIGILIIANSFHKNSGHKFN